MREIFEPVKIGALTAKNRIVRSATNDHLGNRDATVSDAQIDMYRELAENEVGTVITGHLSVAPDIDMRADEVQLSIGDDSRTEGLSRIPDVLHRYGALAVAQISLAGRRGMRPMDFNLLERCEMAELRQWFVDAAVRARKAGFDAVQVHAAHWYMLASVLNSDLNKRTDDYGGSIEGRVRLVREIVSGIRKACGDGFGIFVKINAHNTIAASGDENMLVEYARILRQAGMDMLEVSGMSFSKQSREAECYFIEAAGMVRRALPDLTVSLVGGIYSRETIMRALEVVDMASMSRTLLTQPAFVRQLHEGTAEKSRCIRCNKCFEIFRTRYERCIFGPVNPKLKETFAPV